MKNTSETRVRIAPSPTGWLHLGTARTALFNYLFAKKHGGSFVLRIEDTDRERSEKKFEDDITENLKWLGINWDEFYRQSERMEIYAVYLQKLLDENKAYFCFCSQKDLDAEKKEAEEKKIPYVYSGKCRQLDAKTAGKMAADGQGCVIRFRNPDKKVIVKDLIKGDLEFDSALLGDFVIAKGVDAPLYNFAVVIDDFEMKISHVIRGEDHISNTPKQQLLFEALGLSAPQFAHVPLTLGPDRTKLSKRHGATSLKEYRQQGYLPEAMVNFMVFLGWNPGDEREIFTLEELEKEFDLERMNKSNAIFNMDKLDWYNGYYIRQTAPKKLAKLCTPYLADKKVGAEQLQKIVILERERMKKLSEIGEYAGLFFSRPEYDQELLRWKNMTGEEVKMSLELLRGELENIPENEFTKDNVGKAAKKIAAQIGDNGKLFWPFRVALSGKKNSPPPDEIADILGKKETLARISL